MANIPGALNVTAAQLEDDDVVFIGVTAPESALTTLAALKGFIAKASGTVTVTGATGVDVANAAVTANSVILFSLKTVGGTPAGQPFLNSLTAGVGFNVEAFAGDTSVYNYVILG